jgi:hypothetical protein
VRADGDAGIGDHQVGDAEAADEILRCGLERRAVADIGDRARFP